MNIFHSSRFLFPSHFTVHLKELHGKLSEFGFVKNNKEKKINQGKYNKEILDLKLPARKFERESGEKQLQVLFWKEFSTNCNHRGKISC